MNLVEKNFIPLTEIGFGTPLDHTILRSCAKSFEREEMEGKEESEYLRRRNLVTGSGVVQIDIASVTKRSSKTTGHDRALCDHNCGIEGGYECPARLFLPENRGLKRKDVAPASQIMQAVTTAVAGIRLFNHRFISQGSFDEYCQKFDIPSHIRAGMKYCLLEDDFLVNIFGGNAEMHPDALGIARACHEHSLRTNLTTTGGILLRETSERDLFLAGLLDSSVDFLAITAEYTSGDEIKKLFQMSTAQLRQAWKDIPPVVGQLRKGIETINVLRLHQEYGSSFSQPILNLVVHSGILGKDGEMIEEIIETLKELAPGAKINPYPAQSFRKNPNDQLSFSPADVPGLRNFIARRRLEQKEENSHMVMRPHYFAMLEAVLRTHVGDDETIAMMLSGENTWRCFENRHGIHGAGRVVQVGASPYERDLTQFPDSGGYLACFWDDKTITQQENHVWSMTPEEVANNIDGGMCETSKTVENPCKGCLMPRLNGDEPELELGLDPQLKFAYLEARKESVGY